MNRERLFIADSRFSVLSFPAGFPGGVTRLCILVVAAVAIGCTDRPKAPALGNEPVYENVREGFRFVAPDGWQQAAKADVPPGRAEKERLLVRYFAASSEKAAVFEVTLVDLPESADLAGQLAGRSHGVADWQSAGPGKPITIQGASATQFAFRSKNSNKDVITFRRGGRVYLFTIISDVSDGKGRDLARKAVESVVWTK